MLRSWLLGGCCLAFSSLITDGRDHGATSRPAQKTGVSLVLGGPLVALNGTIGAHIQLSAPAPVGGTLVTLGSSNPLIATPGVPNILIPEGLSTSNPFSINGVSLGSTLLTADAPGCPQATAMIATTSQYISLGTGFAVVPGQTAGLPVSLSIPAPTGGVTIALSVTPPGVVGVQPIIFIPEGSQTPIANPQVTGIMTGSAEITAQAMGFAPDTRSVTVATNVMSFSPTPLSIATGLDQLVLINLQVAAPPGGLAINLSTIDTLVATAPASAFVTPGSNSIAVLITGVAAGTTTLAAAASGLPTAYVTINVITPIITIAAATIGDDLQAIVTGSLTAPAPPGNLVVTLTSLDVNQLLLATTSSAAGSPSIQVTVPAGSTTIPQFFAHALTDTGATQIQASAPGYSQAVGTGAITFAPSGFVITTPSSISTSVGSPSTNFNVRSARLTGGFAFSTIQAVRGGYSVVVSVGTLQPLVGFIANSPLVFTGGVSSVAAEFTPVGAGSTTIVVAPPTDFDTPTSLTSIPATVSSQAIALANATIGNGLQVALTGSLSVPAPAGNLLVTLTSDDPTRLLLSTTPTGAGAASINVTVPAGSTALPTWYAQALMPSGTPNVTASAPAYGNGIATMTLANAGFVIWSPSAISISVGAPPASIQVRSGRLDGDGDFVTTQAVRGGTSVQVDVLSSNVGVGTLSPSPLIFPGGTSTLTTEMTPVASGTTTIGFPLLAAPGFVVPTSMTSIEAAVFDQVITVSPGSIGKDLQILGAASLSAAAPAGNLQVTLTSSDVQVLLLSTSEFAPGTSSITVQVNAGSTSLPNFWVHALSDVGSAMITASAPGYANGVGNFDLFPSGFRIHSPSANFTTSTFSATTDIVLRPARLNPATLAPVTNQRLRGGISVLVPLSSSDPNVGSIGVAPVTHNGGDLSSTAQFNPLTAGTTVVAIGAVAGFSNASANTSLTATVTAPALSLGTSPLDLGVDLQVQRTLSLASAPPNPVTVTVTVLDPSVLVVSGSATSSGSNLQTFPNVNGTTAGILYLQGLSLGSTTVRAQAPGYSDAVITVAVRPSGFAWFNVAAVDTTFASAPTSLQLRSYALNPVTLTLGASQALRGGASVSLNSMSSQPLVGSLAPVSLTISGGTLTSTLNFQPFAAGLTNLNLLPPAGFWTPSSGNSILATVRSPNILLADANVGRNLQLARAITVEAAPTMPTTFRVQVDNPNVVTVSSSPVAVGTGQTSLTISSGTTVGTIYLQGRNLGSTTVSVYARGYEAVRSEVTVDPAGFAFTSTTAINTSTLSSPTTLSIRGYRLNPTTLNIADQQSVRAGLTAPVFVQSTSPAVATLADNPTRIEGGSLTATMSLTPTAAGTTTLAVSTPPGFSTPSNSVTRTCTVTAPTITASNLTLGRDLQASLSASLQAAPPAPLDVTYTISDPGIAIVSLTSTAVGSFSVLQTGVTTTSLSTVTVQGIAVGTTQLTVSASGYQSVIATITVNPSGFVISTPTSITTTAAAANTNVTVRPARLDPVTLNFVANQNLRAGITANVSISSGNSSVGTMVTSPLSFAGGTGPLTSAFDPAAVGMTVISITQPPGWSIPSNLQSISATVNP